MRTDRQRPYLHGLFDKHHNDDEDDRESELEDIPDAVEAPKEPSQEPVNAPEEAYPPPR